MLYFCRFIPKLEVINVVRKITSFKCAVQPVHRPTKFLCTEFVSVYTLESFALTLGSSDNETHAQYQHTFQLQCTASKGKLFSQIYYDDLILVAGWHVQALLRFCVVAI